MSRFTVFELALVLAMMLALQGCGGGNGGGSDKTTTVTTTDTTTLTTTSAKEKETTSTTSTGTSTTTTRTYPGGLRYCEDISTFYQVSYANGTKKAQGMCLPSKSPGAYYTKQGEKDVDGKSDRPWMCFNPDFDKNRWTNEAARAMATPYEGACLFADYGSTTTPDEVEYCSEHLSHHPAVCAPGPSEYWGACWSSSSENWKCVPIGDESEAGLAKGDCKAQVLLDKRGAPTKRFYDGVCRFKQTKTVMYKCDTVATYSSTAGRTCGDGSFDKACFTLKDGVYWQCFSKEQPFSTTPCDWIPLPDESDEFYRGACVFKGNEDYDDAADAHNLTQLVNYGIII